MSGRVKPDLVVRWSRRERALVYAYQSNAGKALGSVLAGVIERDELFDSKRTLAAELDARGYDLTTLRISIRKKASAT